MAIAPLLIVCLFSQQSNRCGTLTETRKKSVYSFCNGPFKVRRHLPLFSAKAYTDSTLESDSAANVIEAVLYPSSERKIRYNTGAAAQKFTSGEVVSSDDPRLSLAYEEFPLHSFELLINRANALRMMMVSENSPNAAENKSGIPTKKRIKLIDLGSGAGRLVVYGALIKGGVSGWDIHGIEISSELHFLAQEILERAIAENIFTSESEISGSVENIGSVCLHLGSAELCASRGLLNEADIIFCYSTAFPAPDFCVEWGAPMLSLEWSELLSTSCSKGCLVVTTDRVLNPHHGWELLEKIEVDNPILLGSVGYIHTLERKKVVM